MMDSEQTTVIESSALASVNESHVLLLERAKLVERKARGLYKAGEYEKAGLWYGWSGYAYEGSGYWERAAFNYGQSGEAYKRFSKWRKAAISYVKSAECYEKLGKWMAAGLHYSQAAFAYESDDDFITAGEYYRRSGEAYKQVQSWQEVGASYEQSGEACRRARAWQASGLSYAQSGTAYHHAGVWVSAEESYCKAKAVYKEGGMYDDASEMHYREMLMKRMQLEPHSWKWFSTLLYETICGYGERIKNVLIFCSTIILLFAVTYFVMGGSNVSDAGNLLARIVDSLYFSVATFATMGSVALLEIPPHLKLFVILEAMIGMFSIPLFVIVLAKRIMR